MSSDKPDSASDLIDELEDTIAQLKTENLRLAETIDAAEALTEAAIARLIAECNELKAIIRDGIDLEWASWETEWLTAVGLEDVIEGDRREQ